MFGHFDLKYIRALCILHIPDFRGGAALNNKGLWLPPTRDCLFPVWWVEHWRDSWWPQLPRCTVLCPLSCSNCYWFLGLAIYFYHGEQLHPLMPGYAIGTYKEEGARYIQNLSNTFHQSSLRFIHPARSPIWNSTLLWWKLHGNHENMWGIRCYSRRLRAWGVDSLKATFTLCHLTRMRQACMEVKNFHKVWW